MANDLTLTQISTVLNEIVEQATGVKNQAAIDASQFVSVAQTALKTGYDPLLNSISQVLSRTIFSVRPYTRKFRDIEADAQRYGMITRKISFGDSDWEDDQRQGLTDGNSVDMYKVKKPPVLQLNYYGQNVFQRHYTVFRDQLDTAFSGPDEFARFVSGYIQTNADQIEQGHEGIARSTVANYAAGLIKGGKSTQVIHLLTEYNEQSGQTLAKTNIYAPQYYKTFFTWVYSRINQVREMMTERTNIFHFDITGKPTIMRHTPISDQRLYVMRPQLLQFDGNIRPDAYNERYLTLGVNESVNFWQSPDASDSIDLKAVYLAADGTLTEEAVEQDGIFGVLFDRDALGYTTVNNWSSPTPFNAAGGYSNVFFHWTDKYWNDFTENGVVFLLD